MQVFIVLTFILILSRSFVAVIHGSFQAGKGLLDCFHQ